MSAKDEKERVRRTVSSRLRKVRKELSLPKAHFADSVELARTNYSKIERGRHFPAPHTLEKLATNLDVSLDWLIGGKGPMFFKEKPNPEETQVEQALRQEKAMAMEEEPGLKPEHRELIDTMNRVPLLHYEVMGFYHRFLVNNPELAKKLKETPSKEESKQ